ncbi:hypothetical protein [Falsiroseomonas sp.]
MTRATRQDRPTPRDPALLVPALAQHAVHHHPTGRCATSIHAAITRKAA